MDLKNANTRLEVNRGIKNGKAGIDRKFQDEKYRGVIRGVAVMSKGNVKDCRNWEIDEITLDQIMEAGKKHSSLGLKSRFGHPNMSNTALGTFLGRANNFYRDGDIARADLFISKTAYETPEGDLASYVLDLAEKDPDAFGTSVVLGDFYLEERMEKGKPKKDENGNELPPLLRVNTLRAVDTVDSPAANNGMFNELFNSSVELSAKATGFLDKLLDNPDALEYVISFLEKFRINRAEIDGDLNNKTNKPKKEDKKMDGLKELTLEQLKQGRPDLVVALSKEGTDSERTRAVSIIKHAHTEFSGMGMEPIMLEAVETGKTFDAAVASMRGKRLEDLKVAQKPGAGPDNPEKGKEKTHLEKAKEYQTAHKGCGITEALHATAEPRKQ